MIESIVFYTLAAVLLISSLVIVTRTNPIAAALSLVMAFVALAGLYGLLSASFVAVIQVLVYAGGIMVLIIFVIMILNLTNEELRPMKADRFLTSIVLVIAGGGVFLPIFFIITAGIQATGLDLVDGFGNITEMSKLIFGKYIFPFEILSLVLLTAVVGALVISKRKL
ncbi:NADH-quinone oxidoreductase subunit J [Leptonema illini]|jgi:NADH-quinone oxidoreductase subunit J|uniref:NADH-quinone oxidoreductase subunit J n=1 Tax=Leptonema illini DSM 21528 TaxID=929563 RepID=H2CA51_9LEPT|nr:NADH-quinone oxidoreductase subunit J [Leptonema illini]EHQ05175.1 NADH dehydrogenase subunit J [Leptonema illini DSM 21528]